MWKLIVPNILKQQTATCPINTVFPGLVLAHECVCLPVSLISLHQQGLHDALQSIAALQRN
jgi:hypothetical protein